jgi:hypothetical protein
MSAEATFEPLPGEGVFFERLTDAASGLNLADVVRAGYGVCGVPGCGCQGFQGGGIACNNCGHRFGQHLG